MPHPTDEGRAKTANANINAGIDTFKGAASFPLKHRLKRLLWKLCWASMAAWTPAPLHRWRIFLLNSFGARVQYSCFVYGSAKVWYPANLTMHHAATLGPGVDCYTMGKIELGAFAVISQNAFLCTGTHDIQNASFQIGARNITIGPNAWIAAEAFVGPGVHVGEGAVLAARGAAFKSLNPWTVYQGNPAVALKSRPKFDRAAPQ